MRVLCSFVLCLTIVALASCSGCGKNADKIVGTWEATNRNLPALTAEFMKDGKLKMTVKRPGTDKPVTVEGTYKIEGDKITLNGKGPDGREKTETMTIKKLTDKELVTEDEKGKTEEFKKIK